MVYQVSSWDNLSTNVNCQPTLKDASGGGVPDTARRELADPDADADADGGHEREDADVDDEEGELGPGRHLMGWCI